MSSRYNLPFADVGQGIKPSSGAKLFFFEPDGVTPKDTFSDQLTTPTPNTNPVIANSNGVFGDIFIVGEYKNTLKDKNDVQIFGGVVITEAASTESSDASTDAHIDRLNPDTLAIWQADTSALAGDVVTTKERSADNGGGATGDVISGTGTVNGTTIVAHNTLSLSWALRTNGVIHSKAFGVIGTDGADDATPAMQALVDFIKSEGIPYQKMYVDHGNYGWSDTLNFDDFIDFEVFWENVRLTSIATTTKTVMVLCSAWVQSSWTGKIRFNNTTVAANAKFKSGFSLQSGTNGTTKNSFSDMMSSYFEEGLVVGDKGEVKQCSENTFYNTNFFECTIAFHGAGAQTGATFIGGNLLATPHVNLPGKRINSMFLEGGFWSLDGTAVLTTESASDQCILMRPHTGEADNEAQYPQLRINGTQMETASPFIKLENPAGETIRADSQGGQVSLNGIGGTSGGAAIINANFISAAADFRGKIQVQGCNFFTGDARNAFNISVGPACEVDIDKKSFGAGFLDWMGGTNGGILMHSDELIAGAFNATNTTYVDGVGQTVKYTSSFNQAKFTRYGSDYNLGTGVFTVPAGGLTSLTVDCAIVGSSLTGSLTIRLNGTDVSFGIISGSIGKINITLTSLVAGDTVSAFYKPSGGNETLIGGDISRITFTAANG